MNISDINPCIRSAPKFTSQDSDGEVTEYKISLSYRLMIITSGKLDLDIDGKAMELKAGTVFFLTPRLKYRTTYAPPGFSCINIAFDMSDDNAHRSSRGLDVASYVHADPNEQWFSTFIEFSDITLFNTWFVTTDFINAISRAEKIRSLSWSPLTLSKLRLKSELMSLITDLAEHLEDKLLRKKLPLAFEISDYVERNYREKLTCEEIAEHFSYHPSYVRRVFMQSFGYSLRDYITKVKVLHATRLLKETTMSVTEIAYYLSFSSGAHFSKVYRQYSGYTPTKARSGE